MFGMKQYRPGLKEGQKDPDQIRINSYNEILGKLRSEDPTSKSVDITDTCNLYRHTDMCCLIPTYRHVMSYTNIPTYRHTLNDVTMFGVL